jgi:hypothetical protein
MTEVAPSELKLAVERTHGGTATFVQSVPVSDMFEGSLAFDGSIAIFDIVGHPEATRAYAWTRDLPDGRTRTYAVLHLPPIRGPQDAVRAAIVAEARGKCRRESFS